MIKIGILKEGKIPPDERVAFTPEQCKWLKENYPCEVLVQKSDVRRLPDSAYQAAGLQLVDDVSDCEVLFGVKEVPKNLLIDGKTYFFFSHTIKEQPYNRSLLQEILKKNIRLIDYECLVDNNDFRLLGFGKYAGIVGTYNAMRMIGIQEGLFNMKKAHDCADLKEVHEELKKVHLNTKKICVTGKGRVASGALEILKEIGVREVSVESYLKDSFDEAVFVQLAVTDYNRRKDGSQGEMLEFFKHPELYESDFNRFAKVSDVYIACHYWDAHAPFIFTKKELADPSFIIQYVADISCDIDGPVPTTLRPSTIEDPFYGIDKNTCTEVTFGSEGSVSVMAVDNLPCELPIDASRDFGGQMMEKVMPALFNGDKDSILKRASIAENGRLTERFGYLQAYVEGE